MPAAYVITYYGTPEDEDAFSAHYRTHHVALLAALPAARRVELGQGLTPDDPYMQVRVLFDSSADLVRAIESPERDRVRRDAESMPAFNGTVHKHTMEIVT